MELFENLHIYDLRALCFSLVKIVFSLLLINQDSGSQPEEMLPSGGHW